MSQNRQYTKASDTEKRALTMAAVTKRIHVYEVRRTRIGYVSYTSVSTLALAGVAYSIDHAYTTISSSDIGTYLSLIMTDSSDLASTWSDVTLSILNALPLGELTLISAGATIALFGCDRIYRFIRSSRAPLYQFSLTQ